MTISVMLNTFDALDLNYIFCDVAYVSACLDCFVCLCILCLCERAYVFLFPF